MCLRQMIEWYNLVDHVLAIGALFSHVLVCLCNGGIDLLAIYFFIVLLIKLLGGWAFVGWFLLLD